VTFAASFVSSEEHHYTGLWQGFSHAVMRLSATASQTPSVTPSFGLKILRDGCSSVNVVAQWSFDGLPNNANFFHRSVQTTTLGGGLLGDGDGVASAGIADWVLLGFSSASGCPTHTGVLQVASSRHTKRPQPGDRPNPKEKTKQPKRHRSGKRRLADENEQCNLEIQDPTQIKSPYQVIFSPTEKLRTLGAEKATECDLGFGVSMCSLDSAKEILQNQFDSASDTKCGCPGNAAGVHLYNVFGVKSPMDLKHAWKKKRRGESIHEQLPRNTTHRGYKNMGKLCMCSAPQRSDFAELALFFEHQAFEVDLLHAICVKNENWTKELRHRLVPDKERNRWQPECANGVGGDDILLCNLSKLL